MHIPSHIVTIFAILSADFGVTEYGLIQKSRKRIIRSLKEVITGFAFSTFSIGRNVLKPGRWTIFIYRQNTKINPHTSALVLCLLSFIVYFVVY
jgi:hypothetical protein